MAASDGKVLTIEKLSLQNESGSEVYTLFVTQDVMERCTNDFVVSDFLFNNLQKEYPLDQSPGQRNLSAVESVKFLSSVGLLKNVTQSAKGNGAVLGKGMQFDKTAITAYSRDITDEDMCSISSAAPNHLSPSEKVRFMELLISSLPKDDSRTDYDSSLKEDASTSQANAMPPQTATSSSQMATATTTASLWNVVNTKTLLSLYIERLDRFSSPATKKKHLWEEITKEINNQGYRFTVSQVEGRWKTVVASYRKHKDEQNKTGAARKSFEYSTEMNEILGDSHACSPKFLLGSTSSTTSTKDAGLSNSSMSTDRDVDPTENDSDSDVSDETTGGNSTKRKNRTEKERVEKRRKSVSGASQMISFLESYKESMDKKAALAEKKAEERHEANLKVFSQLVDVLKGFQKRD